MKIPKNSYLTPNSQKLRKNMTKEEKKLWFDFLKNQNFVVKRQAVIDNFIVDFYIPSKKLVIEIDGNQHFSKTIFNEDRKRDNYFKKIGLTVLRFSNDDINYSFDDVCRNIINN